MERKLLSQIQSVKKKKYVYQLCLYKQWNVTYFSQISLDKYQTRKTEAKLTDSKTVCYEKKMESKFVLHNLHSDFWGHCYYYWRDVREARISEGDVQIKIEFWWPWLFFLRFLEKIINYYSTFCDFMMRLVSDLLVESPIWWLNFFLTAAAEEILGLTSATSRVS